MDRLVPSRGSATTFKPQRQVPLITFCSAAHSLHVKSMNPRSNRLSRRTWLRLASGASAATLTGRFSQAWGQPPQGNGQDRVSGTMFTNPLFAGEYADPTLLRVGADFYITHTPCAHAPALLIWHSRDLVNWTPIAQALKKTYGTVYASDLSEYQGRYFIYLPLDGSLSVIQAEHPGGPWSEPTDLKVKGNDPSHVVGPDGTRYLHFDWGRAVELSADGLSTVGQPRTVYKGWDYPKEWKTEGTWLEGPKLTRRGGYYYLITAEGGTAGPPTSHMVVVARSRSPLGPWENSPSNPLIHTYSAEEEWWSVGHGTLFSTPDDRWYLVYHGYRKDFRTLGRQTLLEPVEWTDDGWPRAPLGARRAAPMPAPMGVAQRPMIELSDPFKDPVLRATWSAWEATDMNRFRVGDGALTMDAKGGSFAEGSPPDGVGPGRKLRGPGGRRAGERSRRGVRADVQARRGGVRRVRRGSDARLQSEGHPGQPGLESGRGPSQDYEPAQPGGAGGERGRRPMAKPGRRH